MERHAALEALPRGIRVVATIGAFDGVHRGHAALIARLVDAAAAARAEPVVVTFAPHPAAVLRGAAPALLCDPAERDARLAGLGVAHLVVEPFDADLADQTAEDFIGRLQAGRQLAAIVMTRGSAFGRGRGGTFDAMTALGSQSDFEVVEQPELRLAGGPVSSSRIRAAVAHGRLVEARRLLGRRPAVTGVVVHGDGRGRTLGFPTANLGFAAAVALPPDGIYAVRTTWSDGADADPTAWQRHADGVASLGVRPTFGVGGRVLEVHLFDIDEDLYDRQLRVAFVRRQRGERRFTSPAALIDAMHQDVVVARRLLSASSG
ncbi:MAG: riboflavin biosynthesis protein RibF [Candidatus Limnocylindrales bacterium]